MLVIFWLLASSFRSVGQIRGLQFDGTPPGAHTQDQAEADVLAALRNIFVPHQLDNLEKLTQVKILLACDDI